MTVLLILPTLWDENFVYKHSRAKILSMVNLGPDNKRSDFFIIKSQTPSDWLDDEQVVFGKVLDPCSLLVICKIEAVPVAWRNAPRIPICITQCGEV